MAGEIFDDISEAYEAMIDWPRRLANEEALYRWLIERVGAKSVVDVACGAGRHAAMLHSWGLRAEGADISEAMIRRAREQFKESPDLHWILRGFDRPVDAAGSFDLAICVGNSLSLAPDRAVMAQAVRQMLAAVRTGGAVVTHVMNLWALPEGPSNWQKCRRASLSAGESLILKGVHRAGNWGFVDLLIVQTTNPPTMQSQCVRFAGLQAEELERMARDNGAAWVEFYGNYRREPYQGDKSQDLIMVAGK